MLKKKNAARKIAVVTGTRAEYGLLFNLLKAIQGDVDLELQLLVSAMHLSPEFGLTYRLIEQDGFRIDAKIEMLLSSDTRVGVAKSVGVGVLSFVDAFERLQPDVLVLLGDRFEILSAAQAALFLKIPIAHIHGGELSSGSLDDSIRHSITKMSHLHFTAAKPYRKRVIQMGEHPDTVFNVGSPGVERILTSQPIKKKELEKTLGFQLKQPTFLITYHPPTLHLSKIETCLHELFQAVDAFPDAQIIFTKSNADEKGRLINQRIDAYANQHKERVKVFTTLGDLIYHSVLRLVNVMIGNSSSGIIEAPSLKVPTVNIGDRQNGRLRANSVIDCAENAKDIQRAIKKALSSEFSLVVKNTVSPYHCDNTSLLIKNKIKQVNIDQILRKRFYDIIVQGHEPAENHHYC